MVNRYILYIWIWCPKCRLLFMYNVILEYLRVLQYFWRVKYLKKIKSSETNNFCLGEQCCPLASCYMMYIYMYMGIRTHFDRLVYAWRKYGIRLFCVYCTSYLYADGNQSTCTTGYQLDILTSFVHFKSNRMVI